MNRIKILKESQAKAERAVKIARVKAKKLEEIDKLKNLEIIQKNILSTKNSNKNEELEKIRKLANSFGVFKNSSISIEPVFDNTISAIKLRMERQRRINERQNDKKQWLAENTNKRDHQGFSFSSG